MKCPLAALLPFLCLSVPPVMAEEPAPPEPPVVEILPQDILSTRTVNDGRRNITLQELDAAAMEEKRLALPVPPPARQAAPEEGGAMGGGEEEPVDERRVVTLFLGAAVHIPDAAQPERAVTLLRIHDAGRTVAFWLPVNFLWLSGHGVFADQTTRYEVMLAVSEGAEEVAAVPAFSSFPADGAAPQVVAEGAATAEDVAAVAAMLEFYRADTPLLRAQYEARRTQAAALEAERAANPPEKKDVVLRYWRADAQGIRAAREERGAE